VSVDVLAETVIGRPRAEVAAFAANPDSAPDWQVNIKSAARSPRSPSRTRPASVDFVRAARAHGDLLNLGVRRRDRVRFLRG
jgi:hypothetical protein